MADNKKIYSIQINGIDQSIKQVDALSDALQFLDKKIKELESRSVSITSSNNGGGSNRISELSTEDKLLKQIQSTEQQIRDARREDYQSLLAQKDILKDITNEAKRRAATERLTANNYSNTMAGMKQELADIKTVRNFTDVTSQEFDKLTQRALQLTNQLKELGEETGQFGRNVGNYGNSMQQVNIQVGNTVRTFANAREASRTLNMELKSMALNGQKGSEAYEELDEAVKKLNSDLKDVTKSSQAMDDLLDTMESFTALGSIGTGFSALFGFDNDEIQKSIQRLMALQNILKGIETIRQQMKTGEGLGDLLSRGSDRIDDFVAGITGAKKGAEGLIKGSKIATLAVRGLSLALKGIGIGIAIEAINLLMKGIEYAGEVLSRFFSGVGGNVANTSNVAASAVDALNNKFKEQERILSTSYLKGYITDTEYARKEVLLLNEAMQDSVNTMNQSILASGKYADELKTLTTAFNKGFDEPIKIKSDFLDLTTVIKNIDDAKQAWKDFAKAVYKKEDVITANGAKSLGEFLRSFFFVSAKDARQDFEQIGQAIAGNWAKQITEINIKTDEGKRKLRELIKELDNDEVTNAVLLNLQNYIDDEAVVTKFNNIIKYARKLEQGLNFMNASSPEGYNYWEQNAIDSMEKGEAKIRRQIALNAKKEKDALIKEYGDLPEWRAKQIDAKYNRQLKEQLESERKSRASAAKQARKEVEEAEKELNELRITNMREGLDKQIAQLREEERQRIQKVKDAGIKVGELTAEIQKLYNQKILDAQRDWAYEMLKTYDDLKEDIESRTQEIFRMEADNALQIINNDKFNYQQMAQFPRPTMDVNDMQGSLDSYEAYYNKLLDLEISVADREEAVYQERLAKELDFDKEQEKLRHKRVADAKTTSLVMEGIAKYESEHGVPLVPDSADADWKEFENSLRNNLRNMRGELVDAYNEGKITFKQFVELLEKEQASHNAKMLQLEKDYASQSEKVTNENLQKKQKAYNDYYNGVISRFRNSQDEISDLLDDITETDPYGFGIINLGKGLAQIKQAKEAIKGLANDIREEKANLKADLEANNISYEDFLMRDEELDNALKEAENGLKGLSKLQGEFIGKWWASIDRWVQAVGQTVNQVLSSIAEIQSNKYDKMIEQQEKYIEEYGELLDKQKDITQEHASAIESIEDELSTARGDRRQQLIDQLNAEMAAQRASLAQQQKIEREKEKAEEKKKKLEHDQAVAKKKMQLAQAKINMAMSISMAAVNNWPIPAIPMMALAAAAGAAQIAAIQSQNIPSYGSGGVIQGKSHREGGVQAVVGNSPIELEGNEFIIRKKSTIPNLNLLDFVNRSEKKLSLEDLINFYTNENGMRKRVISNSPRKKFADGGAIPTLRNDINLSDRMLTAFEDYSNRPVQVAVVDIIDRTQAVNDVRVMAGLDA